MGDVRCGRKQVVTLWFSAIVLFSCIGCTISLGGCAMVNHGPFYGRGHAIKIAEREMTIGPVDPNKGIPGVIELGMTPEQVRAKVGPPLIKSGTVQGLMEPEDDPGDFYGKCYAWVTYFGNGRVGQIAWEPWAMKKDLSVRQVIRLRLGPRTCNLTSDDTQLDVIRLLAGGSTPAHLEVQAASVYIVGTNTILNFDYGNEHDNGRLRSISIIDGLNRHTGEKDE